MAHWRRERWGGFLTRRRAVSSREGRCLIWHRNWAFSQGYMGRVCYQCLSSQGRVSFCSQVLPKHCVVTADILLKRPSLSRCHLDLGVYACIRAHRLGPGAPHRPGLQSPGHAHARAKAFKEILRSMLYVTAPVTRKQQHGSPLRHIWSLGLYSSNVRVLY